MTTNAPDAIPAETELLPCPFCGGTGDPKGWLSNGGKSGPACDDCGASAPSIEMWNRRTSRSPLAAPVAKVRARYSGEDDFGERDVSWLVKPSDLPSGTKLYSAIPAPGTAPSGTAEVEPVAREWRAWEGGDPYTKWVPEGYGDLAGWEAIVRRNTRKYRIEWRSLYAHPPTVEVREPDAELVRAAKDVLAERERQKTVEGWTPEHDDEHSDGELATAAACYALGSDRVNYVERLGMHGHVHRHRVIWPWSSEWWKPKDQRSNLVRAAALIVAEIERLDRRSKHGGNDA